MNDKILSDFLAKKKTLESFCGRTINLLSDLLHQEGIIIHHIGGRTKDPESLNKKIDKKLGKYSTLDDITDLVGVRIISYLESDVDVIAKLISKEFNVDLKNSIDKRELNIDQFGYKSLHLVVTLNNSRAGLTEYKDYKNLKCEIQIRSILQHAWAEIEHDLGYKGKSAIPNQYKRNFNRLAALLETADIEFDRLKRELNEYESQVSELIKTAPQNVKIDQASLNRFNLENKTLIKAREIMANVTGWDYDYSRNSLDGIIERFDFFEMKTIKDIEEALKKDEKVFLLYVEQFASKLKIKDITIVIALYYFQHFLAGKTEDVEKVKKYKQYKGANIGGLPAEYIKDYQKAKTAANS